MTADALAHAKRIVVKTGSALIAEDGHPRLAWLEKLAADIAACRARGQDVILVSSGAVALGRAELGSAGNARLDQKLLGHLLAATAISGQRATGNKHQATKSSRPSKWREKKLLGTFWQQR